MAGNIVKWWKHKIHGGYKQFSVQECTTDSEELMYHQVRVSSSCSAPPDLLMVSDRENNIPLRSPVVNLISTTTTTTAAAHHSSAAVGCSSAQKHHQQLNHATGQQQQQQQAAHRDPHQQHCAKDGSGKQHLKLSSKSAASKFINAQQQLAVGSQQQQQQQQQQQPDEIDGQQQTAHPRHSSHQHDKEERIRLEEFTCDVSVEGGKSTQPLQFSFTFYDLDGHHGKITKDDIVGIVYTIYESIGKSVVVPHCGSKTINVRLTVSPEGKSKSAAAAAAANGGIGGGGKLKKTANGAGAGVLDAAAKSNPGHGHGHTRRQHRYRPRKLIKSDDEDDDSNSDKEKDVAAATNVAAAATNGALAVNSAAASLAAGVGGKSKGHSGGSKFNKIKATAAAAEQQQIFYQQQQQQQQQQQLDTSNAAAPQQQQTPAHLDAPLAICAHENLYENMMTANLKYCTKETLLKIEDCRGCEPTVTSAPITPAGYVRSSTDVYMRQASSRVKMLRKARKQKFQDHCHETRQRSLSVGSGACWYNRHMQQQQPSKLEQPQQQQQLVDVVDGVQLRNPQKGAAAAATTSVLAQRQRNSAECWKTALNRNDLMSIIRESMEKNRLCFQMSGKPQANVSPIRQPQLQHQPPHSQQQQQQQRSNIASKIPTLIANHSNAIISQSNSSNNNNNNHHHHHHHSPNNSHSNSSSHSHSSNHTNNNSSELNLHDISTTNNTQYHPQPHIPIYHQQMAINPAVLAAQSGMQHGAHSKMNLCGYDSFLHATICGGGTSHSPPPTASGGIGALTASTLVPQIVSHNPHANQQQQQQLIATVQPIMNAVPSSQSTAAKVFLNSTTHQIKTSKILRSGSYSQQHTPLHSLTAHSSPQYSGYQRLSSSNAHHSHSHSHGHGHVGQQQLHQQCANKLAALSLAEAPLTHNPPPEHIEKWLKSNGAKQQRKDSATKYADNTLYARLSEKLQESALSTHNQRRKHKSAHKLRAPTARPVPAAQTPSACAPNGIHSSSSNTSIGTYAALIPIHGDPAECENLIAPTTTDDEAANEAPTALFYTPCKAAATSTPKSKATANAAAEPSNPESKVATAKLVDLNDETELAAVEAVEGAVEDPDATLRLSDAAEVEELDAEEGEEDDAEEEAEAEEGGGSAANTSSGASSLIHRYVHEHIHHHYHHFEEKDE